MAVADDYLTVELHDAFGTVIAAGKIPVIAEAITPGELTEISGTLRVQRSNLTRLRQLPELTACILASNYVQDRPINSQLPLYVVIGLPDGG